MKYAQKTTVSVEKSRSEIEYTLKRYGADQFISGWDQEKAYIGFRVRNRMIKITVKLPLKSDFAHTPEMKFKRAPEAMFKAWEQACRQRWRSWLLLIKAKLEAVENGDATIQDEFMAYIMLPDGKTAGQYLKPQIDIAYETGKMPTTLLPWSEE